MKKHFSAKAAACVAALLAFSCAAVRQTGPRTAVSAFRLEFLGDFHVPTGAPFGDLEPSLFGGLSALRYDPFSGELLALSDAKEDCRIYRLRMSVERGRVEVRPLSVLYLRDAEGRPFPAMDMDPEGLACTADGMMYISSEGKGAEDTSPAVYLFNPEGILVRELPVPAKYLPAPEGRGLRGTRPNESFESLTLTPDGRRLYTAGEGALYQDGESSAPEKGGLVRILEFDLGGPEPKAAGEFAYPVEPVAKPADFGPGRGQNGLVELVALGGREFLSLERSYFIEDPGNETRRSRTQIRLFRFSLAGASDVRGLHSLKQARRLRPVRKQLLYDLDVIVAGLKPGFRSLDNFEAMCLSPKLPDGRRILLLVSDNNFSPTQRTAFLAFEAVPR